MEVDYRTAPDSLNEMLSGKLDYGMHEPVFALAQAREGRLRILAVSDRQAARGAPGSADHDRTRHPDGPDRVVGRDGAGRHAEADRRQDQSMVRRRWCRRRRRRSSSTISAATPTSTRPSRARRCSERDVKDWGDYVRLAKIEPQG